jgi:hypothetical protein
LKRLPENWAIRIFLSFFLSFFLKMHFEKKKKHPCEFEQMVCFPFACPLPKPALRI